MKDITSEKMKQKGKILVIDDEPEIGWIFSKILGDDGYEVISSQTGKDGIDKMQKFIPDIVFLDLKLPDRNGVSLLKEIIKINSDILVIMITAHETIETAVAAMKLGAYDYIPKPIPNERLKIIVDKAWETQKLARELTFLKKGDVSLNELIGQSRPMQELFKLIKSVAIYNVNVILVGESGTGKELAARAIYSLSKRKDKPFVPIDCATLPEALVESELFGYEKGAFTGADSSKIGKFEQAHQGTIFLDEIGNLTTHIQVKLLRVLQERKIERLGGQKPIKIDTRIIAATNKNLEKAVKNGEFRDDLYHRLYVFKITLPPLRDREDDIILLSHYFLDKFAKELEKEVKEFSKDALSLLKSYQWPGNVRELENTIKASTILAKDKILPCHLPFYAGDSKAKRFLSMKGSGGNSSLKKAKKDIVEDTERYFVEKILRQTNWNKKAASRILGIDYKTLFTKIKKYSLSQSME